MWEKVVLVISRFRGVRAEEDLLRHGQLDFQTPKKQAMLRVVGEDDFGTPVIDQGVAAA